MKDATDTGGTIPADQMMGVVHGDGGDAVAFLHAETVQCLRKLARIQTDFGPVTAGDMAIRPIADDLAVTMFARRMIDQIGNLERTRLHCTGHIVSPNMLYLAGFWYV